MPKATWGPIEGSPFEDELEEFEVYEGETPPKGLYRLRLKMLRLKDNVNGDKMLNGLVLVNEPAGSKKAQYNGYDTWFNLNITKQGARWVNNFLSALVPEDKVAAVRKAFWAQKVMIDKQEPPHVLSIGGFKITENMLLNATLVWDSYGDGAMKPKTFSRATDLTLNEDDIDASEADEDDEGYEEEEPDDEAEEYDARAEELEGMDRKELLAAAKAAGVAVTRGMKSDAIIDLILLEEFPEDDEELEDEEEPDDEDDEDEEEDEEVAEEEPEEDPEPPKRTRRTRAAAPKEEPKKAPASRRRTAAKEEAPPARERTGRRRKTGEPPF